MSITDLSVSVLFTFDQQPNEFQMFWNMCFKDGFTISQHINAIESDGKKMNKRKWIYETLDDNDKLTIHQT